MLTLPFFWLRAEGRNQYCRCVTLILGDGAVMNASLLPVTSIQGMRSALEWLVILLMAVTSPFTSRSSRICCIQMVPVKEKRQESASLSLLGDVPRPEALSHSLVKALRLKITGPSH